VYEELYEEKFELLLKINVEESVNWTGAFRAPLNNAKVLPRPQNGSMSIWRAVGGNPATSAIKADSAGVPMFLATLGGPTTSFQRSINADGPLNGMVFILLDFQLRRLAFSALLKRHNKRKGILAVSHLIN